MGKLEDVPAKKSAIVSNSGFTQAALNMAAAKGIDTLLLVDTRDPSVEAQIFATMIVRDNYVGDVGLSLTDLTVAGQVETRFRHLLLVDTGKRQTTAADMFVSAWNQATIPHQPGLHRFSFHALGYPTYLAMDGTPRDSRELSPMVEVRQRCWYGELRITESEGLYHVRDSSYATASLTTEPFDVAFLNHWKRIDCGEVDASPVTFVQEVSTPLEVAPPQVKAG